MSDFVFSSRNLDDTARLATALADLLPLCAIVTLDGPLGAGKTRLVQGLAAACGIDPRDVTSPTFVLIHEYHGRRDLFHFDAYRIRDDDEFLALGPEEYFERAGVTLVEWASRVERCLPDERLEIRIEVTGENSRRFHIRAIGEEHRNEAYRNVVEQLPRALGCQVDGESN